MTEAERGKERRGLEARGDGEGERIREYEKGTGEERTTWRYPLMDQGLKKDVKWAGHGLT